MEGHLVKQETESLARALGFGWCDTTPSQEYLHKWLRKEHRMFIHIDPYKTRNDMVGWRAQIFSLKSFDITFQSFNYISMPLYGDEYEDAYEMGLMKALEIIQNT
jgi:hypothetical protein